MGKKAKGAAPITKEEIDVDKFRLAAELAVADSEAMRRLTTAQQHQLATLNDDVSKQKTETEDLYEYVDAQLLATSRERHDDEVKLRNVQAEAERTEYALNRMLDEQSRDAQRQMQIMQADLDAKEAELRAVQEFRGVRPQMETELRQLRQKIQETAEQQQRKEHQMQVDMWRQKQRLNEQMQERIKQAKANFINITAEMLDSTVHRTMHENQNMTDELALQSARIVSLMEENEKLRKERDALRRELHLMRDQEKEEVKRSLARRKLANVATEQHEVASEELRLAQAELRLANEKQKDAEAAIAKLNAQLGSAQRQVTSLTQQLQQQKRGSDRGGAGGGKNDGGPSFPERARLAASTPDWSRILPPTAAEEPAAPVAPTPPSAVPDLAAPPGSNKASAKPLPPAGAAGPAAATLGAPRPQTAAALVPSPRMQPRAPPASARAGSAARATLAPSPRRGFGAAASMTWRGPSTTTGFNTNRDLLSAALLEHMKESGASTARMGSTSARPGSGAGGIVTGRSLMPRPGRTDDLLLATPTIPGLEDLRPRSQGL